MEAHQTALGFASVTSSPQGFTDDPAGRQCPSDRTTAQPEVGPAASSPTLNFRNADYALFGLTGSGRPYATEDLRPELLVDGTGPHPEFTPMKGPEEHRSASATPGSGLLIICPTLPKQRRVLPVHIDRVIHFGQAILDEGIRRRVRLHSFSVFPHASLIEGDIDS